MDSLSWPAGVAQSLAGKPAAWAQRGWVLFRVISCEMHQLFNENRAERLPPQLGAAAHAPEVAEDVAGLVERYIDGLCICEIGYIIQEHGEGCCEGGLEC